MTAPLELVIACPIADLDRNWPTTIVDPPTRISCAKATLQPKSARSAPAGTGISNRLSRHLRGAVALKKGRIAHARYLSRRFRTRPRLRVGHGGRRMTTQQDIHLVPQFDPDFVRSVRRRELADRVGRPAPVELPFIIRLARTQDHLAKAVSVRWQAYSRTLPELSLELREPEAADLADSSVVLLAESKATGLPIGSLRIETNFDGPHYLSRFFTLPSEFTGKPIAWVTRLAVQSGTTGQTAKLALFKAMYMYCLAFQIAWITVGSVPPLDKQYLRLGFRPIFPNGKLVPMPSNNSIPQRMLALNVLDAEREWRCQKHPFYKFIVRDYCPDIQIFSSLSGYWSRPRTDAPPPLQSRSMESSFGYTIV